jgi:signal peptidase
VLTPRSARRSGPPGLSPAGYGWRATPEQTALPAELSAALPAPAPALRRAGRSLVDAVVLLAVLAFAALALGPHLLPYRPVTMLTGSMAPAIPAGSVLIGTFVPRQDVRPGDVITMKAPEGDLDVVTHRVTEVERRGDAVLVRTQGDGNPLPDPWLAHLESDVLRASAALPWVGYPLAALQGSTGNVVLTRVIPGLLVLGLLVNVWRRPTAPRAGRVPAPA